MNTATHIDIDDVAKSWRQLKLSRGFQGCVCQRAAITDLEQRSKGPACRNFEAQFLEARCRKTGIAIVISWLVFQSELVRLRRDVRRRLSES